MFLNLIEESEKFNINDNEFKTGLSAGQGVAKHMEIKNNCDELCEFALEVAKKYKATPVDADSFYDMEMDIYSPCALGATLTTSNIERLKCRVIAGAANNQLEDEKLHGQMLIEKGIVYAPDFVINAGGLINVASELEGYNRDKVNNDVEKIYDRVLSIFKIAKSQNITNQQAAIFMAEKRIRDIGHINSRL